MPVVKLPDKRNFWLGWEHVYGQPKFTLDSPWWKTGYRFLDDKTQIDQLCAAVQAKSAEDAKGIIIAAHHGPIVIDPWRFVNEMPIDWEPFSRRLIRADWMIWQALMLKLENESWKL